MADLISNAFTFLAVVVVAFAVLTLIASFVRFHLLTRKVHEANPGEVDPEDVFQLRVVQELGAVRRGAAPFTLLMIERQAPNNEEPSAAAEASRAGQDAFIEDVRRALRADDEVFCIGDQQCGVLGRFAHAHAATVVQRVAERLTGGGKPAAAQQDSRWTLRLGAASYPEHGQRAVELMAAARAALAETCAGAGTRSHILPAPEARAEMSDTEQKTQKQSPQTRTLLDELTGVLRTDRLGAAAQKYVARQRRESRAVSVLYLSVDYFRQYRDHYGGGAADSLLKGVADILSDHTRETDVLARAAESEFAVVMDCAPKDALTAAQRLSGIIKKAPFRAGASRLRVGVSVGVAGYPDHGGQARDLLAYAEAAMAAARARGRGKCLAYEPDMAPARRDDEPVDMF